MFGRYESCAFNHMVRRERESITTHLSPDLKGRASITMGDVIRKTKNNFPEARFRPNIYKETTNYTIAGIDPSPYKFWVTADGVGTKPELAERLYNETQDPSYFEGLAFDTFAMIDGDEARFGRFLVGIAEVLDTNTAENQSVIAALAKGAEEACNRGRFALLNGETAELGYRTSGYGETRINWNAFGVSIINEKKLILGEDLEPGQTVVAFREPSIRSNGLSKARIILETAHLQNLGASSKEYLVIEFLRQRGMRGNNQEIMSQIKQLFGHDALEQVLIPWHQSFPEITKQLLMPSRIYGSIIYDAQGGIEGERKVNMIAAAHISGGGVPEKGKRMVESKKKLGLAVDAIFPDPEGVSSLLFIAKSFPEEVKQRVKIDDRIACEQWNRGIGFMVVTENEEEAKKLIDIAGNHECEAGIAGEVIDKKEIQFRGHIWRYSN